MKEKLINGLEQDAIRARHILAYTHNNNRLIKWVKRQIGKRRRHKAKAEIKAEL